MTDRPTIDRIPIGTSFVYAVKGAPDIPNQYGSGYLVPTEITLTYRSTTDAQLGRVHAYVKGRWRQGEHVQVVDEKLPGQHYYGDTAKWPDWLAEEARTHDPAAQHDRIAAVLAEADGWEYANGLGLRDLSASTQEHYDQLADAVLAAISSKAADHA